GVRRGGAQRRRHHAAGLGLRPGRRGLHARRADGDRGPAEGSGQEARDRQAVSRELVIASKNKGKIREIREIYADLPLTVVEVADLPDVAEDGDSFSANARKKAIEIARHTGKWALADDSGLEVDALNGAPGIHSARWSGGGDEANNDKLLRE